MSLGRIRGSAPTIRSMAQRETQAIPLDPSMTCFAESKHSAQNGASLHCLGPDAVAIQPAASTCALRCFPSDRSQPIDLHQTSRAKQRPIERSYCITPEHILNNPSTSATNGHPHQRQFETIRSRGTPKRPAYPSSFVSDPTGFSSHTTDFLTLLSVPAPTSGGSPIAQPGTLQTYLSQFLEAYISPGPTNNGHRSLADLCQLGPPDKTPLEALPLPSYDPNFELLSTYMHPPCVPRQTALQHALPSAAANQAQDPWREQTESSAAGSVQQKLSSGSPSLLQDETVVCMMGHSNNSEFHGSLGPSSWLTAAVAPLACTAGPAYSAFAAGLQTSARQTFGGIGEMDPLGPNTLRKNYDQESNLNDIIPRPQGISIAHKKRCQYCKKLVSKLQRHIREVHANHRPHHCGATLEDGNFCVETFRRRDQLRKHQTKAGHGEKQHSAARIWHSQRILGDLEADRSAETMETSSVPPMTPFD